MFLRYSYVNGPNVARTYTQHPHDTTPTTSHMASIQDEWTDDEPSSWDDNEELLLEDLNDSIERWEVVHYLNDLGWLQIPFDLEVIPKEDALGIGTSTLTIAHRMLICFMGWPKKMRPVLDAENVNVACDRFINPKKVTDTCEFNQRCKGWSVLFKALTAPFDSQASKLENFPSALRKYVADLDANCPLHPETLIDIPTFKRYLPPYGT